MSQKKFNRRKFLRTGAVLTGAVLTGSTGASTEVPERPEKTSTGFGLSQALENGEELYNGIRLPSDWPPRDMDPNSYEPMPLPYLKSPPEVIPIDVGRQLFVDDFLIEKTDLTRSFHQPVKYKMNPVLKPETKGEMNNRYCPVAAPFSDGVFYDPTDRLFKLWYMAGWFDGTAFAISEDGIHWQRPHVNKVPGTNLVLNPEGLRRDGASVWLDHDPENPAERFKMYWWARKGAIGRVLKEDGGHLLTSPDGIHWNWRGRIGSSGDNTTFFYNPFRKVWVFTVRRQGRPAPPWSDDQKPGEKRGMGRARSYWENKDFFAALENWDVYDPVFWLGADKFDNKRRHYPLSNEPQLYKVDAVGYESLMLGFLQIHYGPPNEQCAKGGFPKLTELQIAFSRDGFHWDRTNRQTFIGATLQKDSWERAYIHSTGGVCCIVGDNLYFYYTAFQGDESNKNPLEYWSGMYAKASTGLAILRRDGFASMEAGKEEQMLYSRVLKFSGKYLFVNLDAPDGQLCVVLCDKDGNPIPGYTRQDCIPLKGDSTKRLVQWKNNQDIEALAGTPVRFKFYLVKGKIYSFWVSKGSDGASRGATAAGGPGLKGYWDI
ncbi:MAG TPA: hypothetical protein VNT20_02555 [Flavisolibacter sp.]|jgi:hypothetical protein|nr:hypothetical protein [Flavisolibacter sp.]